MPKGRPKRKEPGVLCPKCGRTETIRDGMQRGVQRWRCKWVSNMGEPCEHRFQEKGFRSCHDKEAAFSYFHRIKSYQDRGEKPDLRLLDIAKRSQPRRDCQQPSLSRRTVSRWYNEKWQALIEEEERQYKHWCFQATAEEILKAILSIPDFQDFEATQSISTPNTKARAAFIEEHWPRLKHRAYQESNPVPRLVTEPLSDVDKNRLGTIWDWQPDKEVLSPDPEDMSTYPSILESAVANVVKAWQSKLLLEKQAFDPVLYRLANQRIPAELRAAHQEYIATAKDIADRIIPKALSCPAFQSVVAEIHKDYCIQMKQMDVLFQKIQARTPKLELEPLFQKMLRKTTQRNKKAEAYYNSLKSGS